MEMVYFEYLYDQIDQLFLILSGLRQKSSFFTLFYIDRSIRAPRWETFILIPGSYLAFQWPVNSSDIWPMGIFLCPNVKTHSD